MYVWRWVRLSLCGYLTLVKVWCKSLMNLVERNDAIERRWYCRICLWWMFNEQVSWHARQFNSDSSKIVGSRFEHFRCEIFNRIFHFGFRHVNLRATKPSQNSTWILTEIRGQFLRMNPYWICAHLNLVKIRHKSLAKFVDNFSAYILPGKKWKFLCEKFSF